MLEISWAEAPVKIARMTLTIKLDRNWSSFQLANNTPPLSVTGSVIAPSARIHDKATEGVQRNLINKNAGHVSAAWLPKAVRGNVSEQNNSSSSATTRSIIIQPEH